MDNHEITRREFARLTAAACVGCSALATAASAAVARVVDAGPATKFAAEGVYDAFRNQGFFLVRRGGKLFALSAICTHRSVRLKAEADHSFYCERHGSHFSSDGHVTHGPARRDLTVFATSVDSQGHLLVNVVG